MPPRQLRAVPPQRPSRVVLYRRVSALMGRGGDDFHSPEMQTSATRRHIATLGLTEVGVVEDIDISGRHFNREGLHQIRRMAEAREIDAVGVYDISRLGRNVSESLRFIGWLKERGVAVISANERLDDTTPEGQFMTTQWLALAQLYSDQMGRRWAETITARAKAGYHHAAAPLGYTRHRGDDGKYKPMEADPVIGPAMTKAFRDYAAGRTIADISRDISRARGKPTATDVVKRALQNPTYLGKVVLWGVGKSRPAGWRDHPAYVGDGKHPRLVDDDTWDACARRHSRDSQSRPRHLAPVHPLVSLVYCAACERHMQMHPSRGKLRMECGHKARLTSECPGPGTPLADDALAVVLREARTHLLLLRGDIGTQAAQMRRVEQAAVDAGSVERELSGVRSEMAKLTKGWLAGRVPDSAYEELVGPLRAAEEALARRLEDALDVEEVAPPERQVALLEEMLRLWPDMTTSERNRVLRDVVARVLVRRSKHRYEPIAERLVIEWR